MGGTEGERRTALVVDDIDDGRFMLRMMMEQRGFRVLEAANGEDAVEAVRRVCPDVILMDLNMPRMDGLTAARKIRECKELCRDVPILAVTAYSTYGMKEAAEEAGCDAYVAKPIDVDALPRLGQPCEDHSLRWRGRACFAAPARAFRNPTPIGIPD